MKISEINKLIISSLDSDADITKIKKEFEPVSRLFDFSGNFEDRIFDKLLSQKITPQIEFGRIISWAFPRIALTGVAAIILLLISIFLMEGSFSFNTILGLNESYDENLIISMLTGN